MDSNINSEAPDRARGPQEHSAPAGHTPSFIAESRYTKLVSQGDTGDTCFLLLDGTAEVRHDGHLVVELARGSVFGELALLDGGERLADVIMTSTGEVLEVRKAGFDALMRESPEAGRTVMAQLASRLRESELRRFA